ncbi:MAG: response regulator [Methylophilus sp.]
MNNNTFNASQRLIDDTQRSLELSPLPTAIPQLLNHVVNTLTPIANGKNLTLQCYADMHLNRCYLVDTVRLSEVLHNFITNAIKFTPVQGEIIVRAQLIERIGNNERIRFSVKDNGIGIADEIRPNLLMHHAQHPNDYSAGNNIGLSICQHLAKLLDGSIECESQLGSGSIFSIILTLPICTNDQHAVNDIAETKPEMALFSKIESNSPTLALAVDDQSLSRELLAEILKVHGLTVETAANGNQALSMWKTKRHALIITDCQMPQMDGYTLAKEIRHIEHTERLKPTTIVAWTANLLEKEQSRCIEAGINDFLTKPINIAQIKKLLSDYQQHDATDYLPPFGISENSKLNKINIPVDYAVLEQVIPDSDKQTKVLHQLQTHVHHDYDELQVQIQNADLMGIENVAHRMKGSCKMVGVNGIANLCEEIEKTAKKGNISNTEQTLSALHKSILEFDAFMHYQLQQSANPEIAHH